MKIAHPVAERCALCGYVALTMDLARMPAVFRSHYEYAHPYVVEELDRMTPEERDHQTISVPHPLPPRVR